MNLKYNFTFIYKLFLLSFLCFGFSLSAQNNDSLLFPVDNPSNYNKEIDYDESTNTYEIKDKIGDDILINPSNILNFDEYIKESQSNLQKQFWKDLSNNYNEASKKKNSKVKGILNDQIESLIPEYKINKENIGKIFGEDLFNIKLQGYVELDFQFKHTFRDDKTLPENFRKNLTFNLDNDIQVNADGAIGEKLNLNTDFLTKNIFNRRNEVKLDYTGEEDEIIKLVQLGNVNMPMPGTLITGSQDLFGIKTQLQFGPTKITSVFSSQRTESKTFQVENGGQKTNFEFYANEYDDNRHFFVDPYFYNNYDNALKEMPYVNTLVEITKIEVWITNTRSNVDDLRDVLALTDIGGENGAVLPDNTNNALNPENLVANNSGFRTFSELNEATESQNLLISKDFEKIEKARKLRPTEYTYNPKLGFVSLNSKLRDGEVLAVAFQYTYNGEVKQVGEFSDQLLSPNTIMLKLIKPTILDINHKTWKLMMKNVYSLNAYQVNQEDFELNILYKQPSSGTKLRYIPEEGINKKQLIEVLNLDNINASGDAGRDGYFDFIASPKLTIDPERGKVYLPSVEPFGKYLKDRILEFTSLTDIEADAYTFPELYNKTKNDAQQRPEKNRYILKGNYKSKFGSEISLQGAFNLKKGSVILKQGSEKLIEGQDYIVDYNIGRVTIINESKLNSGTPITINVESENPAPQTKRFLGIRLDHQVNKKLVLGGSLVSLRQAPPTNKVNFGEEPINNTIWGLDGTYQTEAPFLTKLADKLPIYKTTQPSNVFVSAEFAQFLPGHNKAVDNDKGGTAYIDDFENGEVKLSILYPRSWKLGSVPLGTDTTENGRFKEAELFNDIQTGYNRAQLSWFQINDQFYGRNAPENIKDNKTVLEDPYQRDIRVTEIFENKDLAAQEVDRIRPLNLVFDPTEPGPYNFDVSATQYSSGIDINGKLNNPEERWGSIMQNVNNTDWEASNIEYIEFWMMDPYINNPDHEGGDFYINLGSISEDILQDSRKSFENGLPTSANPSTVDTTAWGLVSNSQIFTRNFDAQDGNAQDLGYDGLDDAQEAEFYPPKGQEQVSYLKRLAAEFGTFDSPAYKKMQNDPAKDNYIHFFTDEYDSESADIITRYSKFNGVENNTFNEFNGTGSTVPNVEDIDRNNTLNENQAYYQYKISLKQEDLNLEHPYIAQIKKDKGPASNTNWYLFRVPIRKYTSRFGSVNDFKSIRFIRFFLHNFKEKVNLRFATFSTVRGSWRQLDNVLDPSDVEDPDASFQMGSVNIEEHSNREPYPYVLPPGVEREQISGASNATQQNEQSLSLKFCNLDAGKSKVVYRNLGVNLNNYKQLKLFTHLEESETDNFNDGDISVFVRLGTDYTENYYEYEIPLDVTKGETSDPAEIWPQGNNLDLELQELIKLKLERNKKIVETTGQSNAVDYTTKYEGSLNGNKIFVKGNPNLADVQNFMIGVKNNSTTDRCGEIWLNELRLSDFNQESAIAFRGQFKTTIADLVDLNVSGAYTEAGFGAVDQTLSERRFNTVRDFSANTTINAGKLLPESWGVNLPVYYGVTDLKTTPKFNPLDQDVRYKDALKDAQTTEAKNQLKDNSITTSKYRSFNVSNFSVKPKMKGNPIYNPGNLNFTFSHTELVEKSPTIKNNTSENTKARLGYAYSPNIKPVMPFKNIGFIKKKKFLKPLKEFNFNYLPKSISYSYTVDRMFKENQIRTIRPLGFSDNITDFDPIYSQSLKMNQVFGLKYDLTKSIRLSLQSNTNSVFEGENPDGQTPRKEWINAIFKADSIRTYHQDFDASYKLPFHLLTATKWLSLTAKYKSTYDYIAANSITDRFGNIIQNSREFQLSPKITFTKLYKEIPGVRNYYGYRPNKKKKKSIGLKREITKLKRTKAKPKDKEGKLLEGDAKDSFIADIDSKIKKKQKKYDKEKKKEKARDKKTKELQKNKNKFSATRSFVKLLTMVKTIDGSYRQNNGLVLPGFNADANSFGMFDFKSPTAGFVFGQQEKFGSNNNTLLEHAQENNWIVNDFELNNQYNNTYKDQLSLRAKLEPIKQFTINVNATRNYSLNTTSLFKNINENPLTPEFRELNKNQIGHFDMTILSLNTAFKKSDDLFETFLANRKEVAAQVASNYSPNQTIQYDSEGFPVGFNGNSQEVIIPTFLATYTGKDPSKVEKDKYPNIPLPNFKVRYDGLRNLPFLKKKVRRVSLSSAYSSTYTIGSFTRNLLFDQIAEGEAYSYTGTDNKDLSGNFITEQQINQVVISEKFNPLIKVDVSLRNNLTFNTEYKQGRNLTLNVDNSQMLDENKYSYVIGGGYRLNDVKIFKKGLGKSKIPRSMEFKLDLSYNYNKTAIRNIYDGAYQVSRGGSQLGINASIFYTINEVLSCTLYFDKNNSLSFVNSSFATNQSLFGFKIRYTLSQ